MKAFSVPLFRNILNLGSGETVARLCSIATILFLARRGGVAVVGVFALAQSMVLYTYPFIDFGLRHVGARLIAKYPQAGQEIVEQVQKRRLLMGGVFSHSFCCTRANESAPAIQVFLFLFSAIGVFTRCLWSGWRGGRSSFVWLDCRRSLFPAASYCVCCWEKSRKLLWWLVLGNAAGYGLQAVIFGQWWRKTTRRTAINLLCRDS